MGRKLNEDEITLLLFISRGAKSRTRILRAVLLTPKNCSQIAKEVNLEWWTVQKHLQLLLKKGIIKSLNVGRIKFYKISPNYEQTLKEILTKKAHDTPTPL
jgi:predicted transcriptional regulator